MVKAFDNAVKALEGIRSVRGIRSLSILSQDQAVITLADHFGGLLGRASR